MVVFRVLRRPFWWLSLASFGSTLCVLAACGNISTASNERQCLARAMYFESVRSSDDGMLAVGTVVMNRRTSGKYPKSICGVVGQKNQFAPGVLSKPMTERKSRERAERLAGQVMAGKRHRGVGNAMFFHTAGRTYRFENMHYVAIEGGNAFYERRPTQSRYLPRTLVAEAGPRDSISASGWGRTAIPAVGTFKRKPRTVAVAAASPEPPTPLSIEEIILASNGW